jgi:hypothetical protein
MARYTKPDYKTTRPATLGVLMKQGGTQANKVNPCGNIAKLMVQGTTPTATPTRIGAPTRLNVLMKQ